MADWTLDVFFKRDVTMLRNFVEEQEELASRENS
jgi:hypothetical protein